MDNFMVLAKKRAGVGRQIMTIAIMLLRANAFLRNII